MLFADAEIAHTRRTDPNRRRDVPYGVSPTFRNRSAKRGSERSES